MTVPRTRGLLKQFGALPDGVRDYFEHFPNLVEVFPWEVTLAYLFTQVELAHNMTIYCGLVKCHKVNSRLARQAVEGHHMTRVGFQSLYEAIFGKSLKKPIVSKIEVAEATRDNILHGKTVAGKKKREAISLVLEYATEFNDEVYVLGGFQPFGSLQGFKGRGQALDKSTSRWILKGVGITIS